MTADQIKARMMEAEAKRRDWNAGQNEHGGGYNPHTAEVDRLARELAEATDRELVEKHKDNWTQIKATWNAAAQANQHLGYGPCIAAAEKAAGLTKDQMTTLKAALG